VLTSCATPTLSASPVSSAPTPAQLHIDGQRVHTPLQRWCDEDAAAVESSAPPDIVSGVQALAALAHQPGTLKKHVRTDVQARIERAALLHSSDAELFSAQPLDPMHDAEREVAALLAEGRACNAALVTGEQRIDFPPPFNDTRDENAQEIDAVHELIYAGTSVTAYCGPCPIYALIVAPRVEEAGALDVLAWDALLGADPMRH
jgi:hypothetical protein